MFFKSFLHLNIISNINIGMKAGFMGQFFKFAWNSDNFTFPCITVFDFLHYFDLMLRCVKSPLMIIFLKTDCHQHIFLAQQNQWEHALLIPWSALRSAPPCTALASEWWRRTPAGNYTNTDTADAHGLYGAPCPCKRKTTRTCFDCGSAWLGSAAGRLLSSSLSRLP